MTRAQASPEFADEAFATLLRRLRTAGGLTQSDLAQRAGVGVRTVRDLESGRAIRPQRSTVELLGAALNLSGPERANFAAMARGQPIGAVPARGAPAMRALAAPADLVGRDTELVALVDHLSRDRGVTTLVGLAGVGKTVLAWAAAHQATRHFPGGVVGVSVTAADAESDVLDSLSAVLGVGRADGIRRRIVQPTLILVDGIEHAPETVRDVIWRLLSDTPLVRVIATGRVTLELPGERVWPVGPLEVPPATATTRVAAFQAPASALFLRRWMEYRGCALDDAEIQAVVRLVRRLGGLPLAIELAAARGRVLDPSEMLARNIIDDAASATLRHCVTASYRLLEERHRRAMRMLSTFQHRWSVELAEDLLGTDVDAIAVLDRLVELGLVSVRNSGALRFVMLDVVREFARGRAEAHGELPSILRRHAMVFARYAARIAPALAGPDMTAAVSRLDDVNSDLSAALVYAADHDPRTALCLASKLPRWWRFRGRDVLGRGWLRRLLDDARCADADPGVRAWAMVGLGQLANEHGAAALEIDSVRSAVRLFRALSDLTGELAARTVLFALCMGSGDFEEARRSGQDVLSLATRAGRLRDMTIAQQNLTWHDIRAGDLAAARRRLTEADRLAARAGDQRLRLLIRCNLAEVLRLDGRYAEAVVVGLQALGTLAGLGDPGHQRRVLATIGLAQSAIGDLDDAERTLAELRALTGTPTGSDEPEDGSCAMVEANIALARGQLALASSWFAAAADAYAGRHDVRDVAEALVGLVAATDDEIERSVARSRLESLLGRHGIVLTPVERARIEGTTP